MQITHIIKKYGFTIEQVNKQLGFGEGVLRSYATREESLTLPLLRRIAAVIGCNVGEFFDDEREEKVKEFHGVQPHIDIRSVMHRMGVNNKELAARLHTTEQNVCLLIKKQSMTTKKLMDFAAALNVPITDLFSYDAADYRKILTWEILNGK